MERVVLKAPEGMVYTNGTAAGKEIYLAVGESAVGWELISEEEYEKALEDDVPFGHVSDSEALAIMTGGSL